MQKICDLSRVIKKGLTESQSWPQTTQNDNIVCFLSSYFPPAIELKKKNKIHPYGAFDESSWHQRRHNRENRNEYTTSHVTENNEARLFFCIMYQVPGQISWTELRFLDSVETITAAVALLCP